MAEEQDKAQVSEEELQEQVTDSGAEAEAGDDLQAQLEAARQEAADAKEQALRAAAEAQNVRRRAEKDAENARKFALEKFAGDMLGVADNLERALAAADVENETLKPLVDEAESLKARTESAISSPIKRNGMKGSKGTCSRNDECATKKPAAMNADSVETADLLRSVISSRIVSRVW